MSCCEDPACSHALVAAATKEATTLTDNERTTILGVLGRDEQLRRDQQMKILYLKAELQNLRRKGALRPSTDWESTETDFERTCGRCRTALGRVINRGAHCKACRLRVCKTCREYSLKTSDWVCIVCHKHMEIQIASGEWMNEFIRRPSRRRDNKVYVPAADIIKKTIRRSWTISNPTSSWPTLRRSSEYRPYNSLPRGQYITNFPSLTDNNTESNKLKKYNENNKLIRIRKTQSEDYSNDFVNRDMNKDNYTSIKRLNTSEHNQTGMNKCNNVKDQGKSNEKTNTDTNAEIYSLKEKPVPDEVDKENRNVPEDRTTKENANAALELCDIEPLSGTVFRKVTMRKSRHDKMRKIQGIDTGWRRGTEGDLFDISLPDLDEYKLVFISSDSSSKEEDVDDNESTSTASSFPIDECDWDYFEPGATTRSIFNWNSPFGSPLVYRKSIIQSPTNYSPYRRKTRESDTGTDDENIRMDSDSPTFSDSLYNSKVNTDKENSIEIKNEKNIEDASLKCIHQVETPNIPQRQPCQNCGAPTQYIPIPVPVPIPFPVPTLWSSESAVVLYDILNSENYSNKFNLYTCNFWPYMNQTSLMLPILNSHPLFNENKTLGEKTTSIMLDCDNKIKRKTPTKLYSNTVNNKYKFKSKSQKDTKKSIVPEEENNTFSFEHLDCENKKYMSSTDSSDTSSHYVNGSRKHRVKKIYNINGNNVKQGDNLSSSNISSDEDDHLSHSSVCEDVSSSLSSQDTDQNDSETVVNEKGKRFSRIFVVNKYEGNSNSGSDTDSDAEMDNTVILTKVKYLDETNEEHCDNKKVCDGPIYKDLDYTSSSPVLSDVSTEYLNLSDFEQIRGGDLELLNQETSVQSEEIANTSSEISEWNNASAKIRSTEPVNEEGESMNTHGDGERAGVLVIGESDVCLSRHAARYTSLVMITQESAPSYQQVSVVTTDTTTLIPDNDVIVRHTNWQSENGTGKSQHNGSEGQREENVKIITGADTLSAFEEGLADDDSWVENLSHDEEEFASNSPNDSSSGEEVTLTCSAAVDHEDELRGFHRSVIDFTLHTIVEESCEESEVEQSVSKKSARPASTTDLEKYFFFGLGDGEIPLASKEDAFSETSSIYSEEVESISGQDDENQSDMNEPSVLASSRLEKYFLSGFMGFTTIQRRDSDGSVGSDSEGKPSPEQRRKRLVRARGTGRSHSSSLDNLISNPDLNSDQLSEPQVLTEESSSSDTDIYDELNSFEKSDGQFDTVKRKKNKKCKNSTSPSEERKNLDLSQDISEINNISEEDGEDGHKTPQPEISIETSNLSMTKSQQSRDSGFIGSCDDLIKDQKENKSVEITSKLENQINLEKKVVENRLTYSMPTNISLSRKDSFNNWSSDEETNLMMCKMRQFFKTLIASSNSNVPSNTPTPTLGTPATSKPVSSPRIKNRFKSPQLIYFENELTRLMKTVPGIRDDQVREIVEYLSSEDTWSDSYDSSDYTSSDLEGASTKSALQQQISDSCKQIINKFDTSVEDEEGDEGDGGIIDETVGTNKETAFVYQKLVASFEKIAAGNNSHDAMSHSSHNSPPLIAKVMHHIGSRLVALMHEVSSGESHSSNSPKNRHYHRKLQQKLSSTSTTTDEDSTSDSNLQEPSVDDNVSSYTLLQRSKSHDLLTSEIRTLHQSSSGVSDITEEKETSDCDRFSWRGSFESALLATDSRNKLSLLGSDASLSVLAAKRRSAGDLLFNHKSRENLDRVRSCGSIGGGNSEDKLWVTTTTIPNRRSSVPDATCGSGGSADGEDEDEDIENRSTLPRTLQTGTVTTNSLPRLPINSSYNNIQKAQSMYQFLPQNAKSARYRPPGFSRLITTIPKRAVSAPGLHLSQQRRNRRSNPQSLPNEDANISHSSPILNSRNTSKSGTPSPVASNRKTTNSLSNQDWHTNDNDPENALVINTARSSLSNLGLRSDSMASVYSGAGEGRYGSVAVRGQVEFGLQYNYKSGALEIQIKQCKDLAPVDIKRNRSDPYVKVYLLPDKSKSGKRKTKVKKHTLNPVFDENLKFHISLNGLETRTLWLTVWHSDMFGRNDFLGEVMMNFENKVFDDPTPKWYNLQERTEPFDDMISFKGDITVCLKFVPPDMTVHKKGKRSRGALHVLIKEAKSLTAIKANGTSDPFCKSYLLPEKGRNSKQKTPIAKRTVNPIWNYTFIYDDVTLQELAERCLELTVWDHDRLASNEFLGGVRFSLGTGKHYGKPVDWMDASGKEVSLWKSMLEKPNFWVEGCLPLRPSLEARAT